MHPNKPRLQFPLKEHIMNNCLREAAMMDGSLAGSARDERGRFVPGQSGNPMGKVSGTRNRATLLRAALDSEEGSAMARIVIDKALAGDVVTARFCLDRLEPRPRGRAISIELPEGARMRDVVAAFDATVRAMAGGEITPDEAVQVTRVLDGRRKAIEAAWRERRTQRDRAADDVEDEMEKPSPPGRGLGEGLRRGLSGNAELAVGRPHPDPLPRGEGIVRGARSAGGSFLKERGASAIANLLHSTCISTPSGAMGWAGAGTAAGLA
jgi:hypothetical protein